LKTNLTAKSRPNRKEADANSAISEKWTTPRYPDRDEAMNDGNKNVVRRAGIVGASTLASRVLGLVRESVVVSIFPKEAVDAFQTAFLIPNTFRRLTGEGAFSPAVVSVFSKIWAARNLEESKRFVRAVLGFSLIFLSVLTIAGVMGADLLTWLATWGSGGHSEKYELTVRLTRFMFPYILFISLTALAMGILNSTGRFFAPSFAPVLLNIAVIGCAFGLTGSMPAMGIDPIFSIAAGVIIGGVAQALFQLPSLKKAGLLLFPSIDLKYKELIKVLRLTAPMIVGAASYQVGIIFNTALAWTLPDGSVMYINSANRLIELPLAVLVMAISIAALPNLSALYGKGKIEEMKTAYSRALKLALYVSTPAMVALATLAEPIICVLYQRGHFTYAETLKTVPALQAASIGICSMAFVRQTVPVFYAVENSKTPMMMTMLFVIANGLAGFLLKGPFLHVGLCMAISIAPTVQAVGLIVMLRKKVGKIGFKGILKSWGRVLSACVPMCGAVFGVSLLGDWKKGGNSICNIAVLLAAIVTGTAVFAAASHLLNIREFNFLKESFLRRRRKS
jgi:putative peptidoglycan lipid II flippase